MNVFLDAEADFYEIINFNSMANIGFAFLFVPGALIAKKVFPTSFLIQRASFVVALVIIKHASGEGWLQS